MMSWPGGVTCALDESKLDECMAAIDAYADWYERAVLGCPCEEWLSLASAEDFFGWQRRLTREREEMTARLAEIEVEYEGRSGEAKGLARMPFVRSLAEMEARYGRDPDARAEPARRPQLRPQA